MLNLSLEALNECEYENISLEQLRQLQIQNYKNEIDLINSQIELNDLFKAYQNYLVIQKHINKYGVTPALEDLVGSDILASMEAQEQNNEQKKEGWLKRAWEAIKRFFRKLWNWISGNTSAAKKKLEHAKNMLDEANKCVQNSTIELDEFRKKLYESVDKLKSKFKEKNKSINIDLDNNHKVIIKTKITISTKLNINKITSSNNIDTVIKTCENIYKNYIEKIKKQTYELGDVPQYMCDTASDYTFSIIISSDSVFFTTHNLRMDAINALQKNINIQKIIDERSKRKLWKSPTKEYITKIKNIGMTIEEISTFIRAYIGDILQIIEQTKDLIMTVGSRWDTVTTNASYLQHDKTEYRFKKQEYEKQEKQYKENNW